jgi:hypothetical protein
MRLFTGFSLATDPGVEGWPADGKELGQIGLVE